MAGLVVKAKTSLVARANGPLCSDRPDLPIEKRGWSSGALSLWLPLARPERGLLILKRRRIWPPMSAAGSPAEDSYKV
jgi:hypothetical protein